MNAHEHADRSGTPTDIAAHPSAEGQAIAVAGSVVDRRTFVRGAAALLVAGGTTRRIGGHPGRSAGNGLAGAVSRRAQAAYRIRHAAAIRERKGPAATHEDNGDLDRYPTRIGSFSKGLPHDSHGVVDSATFDTLVSALRTGTLAAFEKITLAGTAKLVDPLAGLAFDLEGADPHRLSLPAPPAFASAAQAAEMAELYWQALTRDIPFSEYGTDPMIANAANDLSGFSAFSGPRAGGRVVPGTLFRGASKGDVVGPYLSQLLLADVPYGAMSMTQRCKLPVPGTDFLVTPDEALRNANGSAPARSITYGSEPRYIRTGRDLAEYVHRDYSYQAFLDAAQILLAQAGSVDGFSPYATTTRQVGFVTFGGPHILDLVARVAGLALKTSWYQKWFVHLRARPEQFALHVQTHLAGTTDRPIHEELLGSAAVATVLEAHGNHLLPVAYPEGSPLHPAYPAGHAAIAGACATVLKAFFNEERPWPAPVVPSADGASLVPYGGGSLTVGGEIDKLASNIAIGRDAAGIHWRSDGIEGIRLGEKVALSVLRDFRDTYAEPFDGWSLTTYDDETVRV